MMIKRGTLVFTVLMLMALALAGVGLRPARAQDPTVPTRTPTPGPGEPTRTNPTATRDGSTNPQPSPTNTVDPDASPTATTQAGATQPAAGGQTPVTTPGPVVQSGSAATGACDETPYVRATKQVVIYAGPGGDYEVLGTLEIDETRPILGRAGFADWWQIQFSPGVIGWTDDEDVDEFGNTGLVSVVPAPPINGFTPTPGPAWNPTPSVILTCEPSPTPTTTNTPTHTPTATAQAPAAQGGGGAADSTTILATEDASSAQAAETTPGSGVSARGGNTAREASPTSTVNLILPLAGLALIAGGIALALMTRNSGKPADAAKDAPKEK